MTTTRKMEKSPACAAMATAAVRQAARLNTQSVLLHASDPEGGVALAMTTPRSRTLHRVGLLRVLVLLWAWYSPRRPGERALLWPVPWPSLLANPRSLLPPLLLPKGAAQCNAFSGDTAPKACLIGDPLGTQLSPGLPCLILQCSL